MGIMDRDWYREDLAKRLRRIPGAAQPAEPTPLEHRAAPARLNRGFWLTGTMLAVVMGIVVAAPPILTSRCDQTAWQIQPVRCWQYSWQALSARVEGNMAATRGWPVVVVQGGR
jgi:hypothetical protein